MMEKRGRKGRIKKVTNKIRERGTKGSHKGDKEGEI